ncbi:MAG: preprotein translocase subunit SecY [Phycisphaerae bacterium]|nr:preprotein translocase subunit SecY [Phycisphaerae bacterium]
MAGRGVEHLTAIQAAGGNEGLAGAISSLVGALLILAIYYYALWTKSNVRRVLENIFSVPELIGKIVFTMALLAIYRIGFHVPLVGVNQDALTELAQSQQRGIFGEAMAYFSMFTGGSLQQSSLFGLGIMPYISASIIFTLLVNVVPALERLQKEGPAGHKKIQEYTRYATVGLCLVQAIFWMRYMMSPNRLPGGMSLVYPEYAGSTMVFLCGVIGLTAGTIFLMWLGEQIDEYGIGNGISLLIMAGIVVRLPVAIQELASKASFSLTASAGGIGMEKILFLAASFVFVVAGAILITQGQRRIPIQQAKQTRGRRTYGGQRHYMPLRVNHGGVMPIIFASSLMIFPGVLTRWAISRWPNEFTRTLEWMFSNGSYMHTLFYIGLIFFFAYFWTTVNFRPKDMADQLRDMGHFIPGLRPGKRTADYLERVMERITYCGAAFLAVIAVLPTVVATKMDIPFEISAFLGGTGLLIMVSVTLDLVQRIEANLVMRNYGGFLGGSSRIKGAYA